MAQTWPNRMSSHGFCLALRGHSLPLAAPELGSLLGLTGLGRVWMEHALIHGLENPSLVIYRLSLRPGPGTGPPTSSPKPRSGGSGGPLPLHCA